MCISLIHLYICVCVLSIENSSFEVQCNWSAFGVFECWRIASIWFDVAESYIHAAFHRNELSLVPGRSKSRILLIFQRPYTSKSFMCCPRVFSQSLFSLIFFLCSFGFATIPVSSFQLHKSFWELTLVGLNVFSSSFYMHTVCMFIWGFGAHTTMD